MQRARRAALHLAWHDRALLCTRDGALASHIHRRFINEDRDGSQMEELLERTVVRAPSCCNAQRKPCSPRCFVAQVKPQKKDAPTVLTTRREALSLYRAVRRTNVVDTESDVTDHCHNRSFAPPCSLCGATSVESPGVTSYGAALALSSRPHGGWEAVEDELSGVRPLLTL